MPWFEKKKDVQVGDATRREIHREMCLLHGRCEELGSENEKIVQQLAPDYAHRLDNIVAGLVKHNRRNRRLRGEGVKPLADSYRPAQIIANSLVDSGNV